MILITKTPEPQELTDAKRRGLKDYKELEHEPEVRRAIKQQLLSEQGHLCAYCMQRITIDSMGIEHYIPQHPEDQNYDPALTIDYRNMLAVCKGNEQNAGCYQNLTCDKHRKNQPLTVDPCSVSSISHIRYRTNAEIYSEDPEIDHDVNIVLNLNNIPSRLPQNRKSALDALQKKIHTELKGKSMTKAYCQKFLDYYKTKNAEDELTPYVGILIAYLEKRLRQIP